MATRCNCHGKTGYGLFAVAAAICVGVASATSTPRGWTDDFEEAQKQAEKEGKLMLVDFSGSDWCGWCKKLDSEVFAKPEFLKGDEGGDLVQVMYGGKYKICTRETMNKFNLKFVKDWLWQE